MKTYSNLCLEKNNLKKLNSEVRPLSSDTMVLSTKYFLTSWRVFFCCWWLARKNTMLCTLFTTYILAFILCFTPHSCEPAEWDELTKWLGGLLQDRKGEGIRYLTPIFGLCWCQLMQHLSVNRCFCYHKVSFLKVI